MNLNTKVAIITGGALGLGKDYSKKLLECGIKGLTIVDINKSKGEETVRELSQKYGQEKVIFVEADVTLTEMFENAFKQTKLKFGKIDIVCNNAGIANEFAWEKCLQLNLHAVIRGTYLAVQYMGTKNGGSGGVVINMSSAAGLFPSPHAPVYSASKHGVVGFTRSASAELDCVENKVRINCLCPTFVKTPMVDQNPEDVTRYPKSFLIARDKLGIMTPDSTVEAFMQLIQDENCNGAVMSISPRGTMNIEIPNFK